MPRRVLDSHLAAARRWDVGYRLLTEADLPGWDGAGLQAAAAKLLAFRFTAVGDVLLLDADALVSPAAPSPWDLRCGAEEVLLVTNWQGAGRTEEGERQARREWERLGRLLGDAPPPLGPLEGYGNTGFVLAGRALAGPLLRGGVRPGPAGPACPGWNRRRSTTCSGSAAPRCAGWARSGTAPTRRCWRASRWSAMFTTTRARKG